MGNATIEVEGHQNVTILNGVTSFDLILIQSHILGNSVLGDSFKKIAADVNLDGNITTFDIINIQQVIVGNASSFPEAESWEFINSHYFNGLGSVFTLEFLSDPFNMPTSLFYPSYPDYLGSLALSVFNTSPPPPLFNLYGIKMGDVNANFQLDPIINEIEDRAPKEKLSISNFNNSFKVGDIIEARFSLKDLNDIVALQADFSLSNEYVKIISIDNGDLPELPEKINYIGKKRIDDGFVSVSWFDKTTKGIDIIDQKEIFTIKLEVLKDINPNTDFISITHDRINNLIYQYDGTKYELLPLIHLSKISDYSSGKNLYTVYPNPFSNELNLTFYSNGIEPLIIELFDLRGKKIIGKEVFSSKGWHNFNFIIGKDNPSGVYTLRVSDYTEVQSFKVIKN